MLFIATCKMGVESLTAHELRALGIEVVAVHDARVIFKGGFDSMARACLWLRTAERVLMEVGSFTAATFDELFNGVRAVNWKDYLAKDTFIHVNGKSAKSTLFSVSDCQSITKKAIVENLKSAYRTQTIPETGKRVIVEVGLLKDRVTLALDCCGAGLSRRGYRTFNVDAPISETLGASIVILSGYKPDIPLYDPMCGSGTMPIEAAMIATNRAPGLNRDFAAEEWQFLDRGYFERARSEAKEAVTGTPFKVFGGDIDARCIDICKRHAKKAGVMLDWAAVPIRDFAPSADGIIVCNPPYGERLLNKHDIKKLYIEMRDKFNEYPGCSKHIVTSNLDFERIYGRRADRRRNLSNGGIKCTLYSYYRSFS